MTEIDLISYQNRRRSTVKDLTSWGDRNNGVNPSVSYDVQPQPQAMRVFTASLHSNVSYNPAYNINNEASIGNQRYEGSQRTRYNSVQQQHDYFVKSIVKSTFKTYQQVKLDRLNRILKITGTTWGLIAVSLIIVSAIGAAVPQQTTGYKCLYCPAKEYYSAEQKSCLPQLLNSFSCSSTVQCRSDLGLSCRNSQCSCSDRQHWNTDVMMCVDFKTYMDNCNSTNLCGSPLYCTNTSACNCPSSLSASYQCDCPRTVNNEYYWNNVSCQPALSFGGVCSATYMCQTLTQYTLCSGSLCQCIALYYYNTVTSKCVPQLLESQSCALTSNCRTDLGLSCQSGLCKCNAAIQFWGGLICTNYYTYNNQMCTNSSQCNYGLGLICRTSGLSCNCPSTVVSRCDCPTRSIISEYFWNSTGCQPSRGYNQPCTSTYMCQSLSKLLICYSGTCNCGSGGYWSTIKLMCLYCDSGWTLLRDSCFRISSMSYNSITDIVDGCFGRSDSRLALLQNEDTDHFNSLYSTTYLIFNRTEVDTNYNATYWCASTPDLCVVLYDRCIQDHICTHSHKYICEYVLN